jgi:hypothetical protein
MKVRFPKPEVLSALKTALCDLSELLTSSRAAGPLLRPHFGVSERTIDRYMVKG